MSKIFTTSNQLVEWVDAILGIQERYGIEKALGKVIGERFYNLVDTLHIAHKICPRIEEHVGD